MQTGNIELLSQRLGTKEQNKIDWDFRREIGYTLESQFTYEGCRYNSFVMKVWDDFKDFRNLLIDDEKNSTDFAVDYARDYYERVKKEFKETSFPEDAYWARVILFYSVIAVSTIPNWGIYVNPMFYNEDSSKMIKTSKVIKALDRQFDRLPCKRFFGMTLKPSKV